tara:strand:- start:857 stop:1051 length:195 start_codon:yes stop_codon:yes gene_type:complete
MSWWKKPKCTICKKKMKSEKKLIPVEMQTAEGPHEMKVCDECAKFFDAMIETLEREYGADDYES